MVIHVRAQDRGFTYLAILFLVALMSAGLAVTGVIWSTTQRRENEAQLLRVGDQIRTAIGRYYEGTPGSIKRYPTKLEDLLEDKRQLALQRYLRRLHRDPITGGNVWGLIRAPDGGIMGVHSISGLQPIKVQGFPDEYKGFSSARAYADWLFVYVPAR